MELFASTGQMFIEPGYLLYIFFREDVFALSVMPSCEVSFVVKLVIISPLFSMSGVVV